MGRKALDLAGKRFGRLVVIEKSGKDSYNYTTWTCKCDCGNTKSTRGVNLTNGNTQSCGCLQIEKTREANLTGDTPFGLSLTPEYDVWHTMIARCTKSNHISWDNYGGRGITVCQHWRSFKNFYEDMCPRPEGRRIDRINNDDGYHCGHCDDCKSHGWVANCRWATWKEQSNNRRPRRDSRVIR